MTFHHFVLCFSALYLAADGMEVFALRHYGKLRGSPGDNVSQAVTLMKQHPKDPNLNLYGCWLVSQTLIGASNKAREALGKVGVLPVLAAAMENHMTNKTIFICCTSAMEQTVVFHRTNSLLMNATTHALETLIKGLRMYPHDKEVNHRCLHALAGFNNVFVPELTPRLKALGGFNIVWDALDYFSSSEDGYELLSSMQALSDPSHNKVGAETIANHGGKNKGIEYLVNLLGERKPYTAHDGSLTLKYEVMQVANGILSCDENDVYNDAFTHAGFLQKCVEAMRGESDIRTTQDVGCEVIKRMTAHSKRNQDLLVEAKGIDVVIAAMDRFKGGDQTAWPGMTLGTAYPVLKKCAPILLTLARGSTVNKFTMRLRGLPKILDSIQHNQTSPEIMTLRNEFLG